MFHPLGWVLMGYSGGVLGLLHTEFGTQIHPAGHFVV